MTDDTRWIARIAPTPGSSVDDLLQLPLGLDVWERQPEFLVVAATARQLQEIEQRRLGQVEWIDPVAAYLLRQQPPDQS